MPEEASKDSRIYRFREFLELGQKVDDGIIQ
jgi:hypothetical protein